MYKRALATSLLKAIESYPVVALVGPRQSGKTTLCRELFSDYKYVLLEDPETRRLASSDPRSFFERYEGSLILDEVQKTPELLSYIQGIVDSPGNQRSFVLTGSEHLLLSEKITQSLAGRVRLFTLLPLSQKENKGESLLPTIFTGGYPRIHDKDLNPQEWLAQYYNTYIQKDVRNVLMINDLDQFDRCIRLVAGRTGQLVDFSSLAADCGASSPTMKSWLSILKATFIIFTLEPHFKNFNKRIIKSPKIYFYDTGLLCYLLRIRDVSQLETHPLYGNIFENWVIAEELKALLNAGEESNLYFWRSHKGKEVDLIKDEGQYLNPTEIKSSKTFHESFISNLRYFQKLQGSDTSSSKELGRCIYGGDESYVFKDYAVTSWQDM